jgi:hypothetical protein
MSLRRAGLEAIRLAGVLNQAFESMPPLKTLTL